MRENCAIVGKMEKWGKRAMEKRMEKCPIFPNK